MKRHRDRLSDRGIRAATGKNPKPGMYADGLGLYLSVSGSGSASWLFRYKIDKRPRTMGLGSLDYVTLAQARELADAARRKVRVDSVDPLEERRAAKVAAGVDRAKAMTFRQCAEAYIRGHRAGWQNAKHSAQWATTLEHYAYPVIGDLPVAAVGLHLVLRILEPIWTTRTATATRLRGRIEAVLSWATTRGLRTGDNPAMWRGRLETLLPAQARITPVEHHKALDYRQIGALMTELRQQESVAARALEFMILTATRTGEVRRAQWSEVDLVERLWTIPAERTKTKKEHRVPLSDAAMAILKHVYEYRLNQYVFPGHHGGAISDNAMLVLAKKFGGADMTAHGFRSTFRDWAAERSSFPNEVAEMALGHTVGGAVERAYRRGDLFDKRRQLAEAWSRYCAAPASEGRVVPIRGFGE